MEIDNKHGANEADDEPMKTFTVRLPASMVQRIDDLIPRLNVELRLKRHFGHKYKRSDVIRAIVTRGIDAVTKDFDSAMDGSPGSDQNLTGT